MTLGRKGLTSGVIQLLTVCCDTSQGCAVLLSRPAAYYLSAVQRDRKQHIHVDRREICVVYTQISPLSALQTITKSWPKITIWDLVIDIL
ncbi:unnamed protein product, partial [Staurois parvus]